MLFAATCLALYRLPAAAGGDGKLTNGPLSPFQFPFYSLPDEGGSVLASDQDGLDPVKSPLRESGLHILCPKFFASHAVFLI